MRYLTVLLNIPRQQSFTYRESDDCAAVADLVGFRADIAFGARRTTGFIVAQSNTLPADCPVDESKIRPILRLSDTEPLFTRDTVQTASWLSRFYLCSEGEALSAMLPGGKRESSTGGLPFVDEAPDTSARTLSEEQRVAVDGILDEARDTDGHNSGTTNGNRFHYLYGATGTGKTEVFLQVAERLLRQGKGVIYLVPEIGLTQQVVAAVLARFGQTVAVLHSGLAQSQRLSEWRRILHREARVVIGARSAIFAPVPDLGLIIIDEEHDGSYKSESTPRYHARQVAMHRATQLKIPLVMGSATPSVEAWHAMHCGLIRRHTLTRRLAGGAMPTVSCIDLSRETGDDCISAPLATAVRETLAERRQTILFLNRRGFTHFFRCASCGYELHCKNCSIALTYHKREKRLRCHYCGWTVPPPQQCPACGSLDVGYSGFGTEYIEAEVAAKFPAARVIRIDTDTLTRKGELAERLSAFRRGDYDILLGTQMVAKGLNFPNLKLVGVILADTGLHLPDFRAAERTFALLTQVAGRAGRFFPDGRVLIQTYSPHREPIACAVQGAGTADGSGAERFYTGELAARKLLGFPPFSRLVRLVFRAPTEHGAERAAMQAADILRDIITRHTDKHGVKTSTNLRHDEQSIAQNPSSTLPLQQTAETAPSETAIELLGPAACPLAKIASNWRYQLLLRAMRVAPMQQAVATFLEQYRAPTDVYIACDVDPQTLL